MTGTFGQSTRAMTEGEISRLAAIDARLRDIASSIGAVEMRYPTLIAGEILCRAEYPEAFPHLLMPVSMPHPTTGVANGDATPSAWCLSPAVCYHTYAQFHGQRLRGGVVVTARGRCFRAEEHLQPGVRQVEFEMREIVLLGTDEWVRAAAQYVKAAVEEAAMDARLCGVWEPAEDPFFLPQAAGKALMQRLLQVKLEYRLDAHDGLALASVNRHGTFFGTRFDISTAAGDPAHTACIAVGLDRWQHASRPLIAARPAGAVQVLS